ARGGRVGAHAPPAATSPSRSTALPFPRTPPPAWNIPTARGPGNWPRGTELEEHNGTRLRGRPEMSTATKGVDDLPVVEEADDGYYDSPTRWAEMARRHGPIFKRRLREGLEMVVLVGPEANKLVLYTHREHFSHEQGWTPVLGLYFGKGLLNMDGEEWARHRKMMNPAFTAAYMATYLPVMNRIIRARTRDWVTRGEVDLYTESRR